MEQLITSRPLIYRGKVGELYSIGEEKAMLLVRSDRVSGLNVNATTPMPGKGVELCQISRFWMRGPLGGIVPHHLTDRPLASVLTLKEVDAVEGRAEIVTRLKPLRIEAVVRRHLFGTGYQDYAHTGEICGIPLPADIKEGDRLDTPIFTPAEKTTTDPNITFATMCELIGTELAKRIRDVSLHIFARAEEYLYKRGIILADTKFEFGTDENGVLTLMDEVLTPDSSHFWLRGPYQREKRIISLDKQKVRDCMAAEQQAGRWDGETPIDLPTWLIREVSRDYREIRRRITEPPSVAVVMGSVSDWNTMVEAAAILAKFGIPYIQEVLSAHRTPHRLAEFAACANERGLQVIIAGAGGAAHLPGMLAAQTEVPVLGVPVESHALSGVDSLLSIIQMPKGVPVATFAIGNTGAANAALFAVAMLARSDPSLLYELRAFRAEQAQAFAASVLPKIEEER